MKDRARFLNSHTKVENGAIVYWMSRDQRVHDNWALLHAQDLAQKHQQPLLVVFCLQTSFLGATVRQFDFMLKGLLEVSQQCQQYSIPFMVIQDTPQKALEWLENTIPMGAIVTDFSPLKISRNWKKEVADAVTLPVIEVDAHNIIPAWIASDKQEFAAYTFRPKVYKNLDHFLTHFPQVVKRDPNQYKQLQETLRYPELKKTSILVTDTKQWRSLTPQELLQSLSGLNQAIKPVSWCIPGEKAAHKTLIAFIAEKLTSYDEKRNDPTQHMQSNLSPYLHFGHISSQTVALAIQKKYATKTNTDTNTKAFLEELIVRKELADNFCLYNSHYDSSQGFHDWAKKSLAEHRHDKREYLYTLEELEQAKTHDELWNAAQLEMVKNGKMHGYLRMYWAKKILEWTQSPEQAVEYAIYLNDMYELDGRDPNGYVGILWSIGGVHDRAWFEREIFGKVRYMNYNGAKKKFNIAAYIQYVSSLQ